MKIIFSLFLLSICWPAEAEWYQKQFEVMGTVAKVEFESDSADLAKNLIQQVIDEMNRIDRLMSPFKSDSELSKMNQLAAKGPVKISQEMLQLLTLSRHYSEITQGGFDITFSSVGYLYDFRKGVRPTEKQKKSLVASIDYTSVILDPVRLTVTYRLKDTKIDLGGIAKGHAVDQSINILKNNGIKNAFVNAGGDSRVIGKKQDRLWYIGVRHPRDESKLIVNLPLENVSISTSGDYERFYVENNIRYHHIINPITGDSVRDTMSVTILADSSTDADALSTSIFVLGPIKGLKLVNSLDNVSAIIIDRNGKMTYSEDLISAD